MPPPRWETRLPSPGLCWQGMDGSLRHGQEGEGELEGAVGLGCPGERHKDALPIP